MSQPERNSALPAKKKYESPRQLARQANILAVARQMLAEIGYDRTTVRGLAERAHVAPGTLYNLYRSKDELIVAAVEEVLEEVGARVLSGSQPGLDRVVAIATETSRVIRKNPPYAEAMTRAMLGGNQDDPITSVLYARYVPFTFAQLREARRLQQLRRDVHLRNIATHLQAQSWGVVVAWIMGLISLEALGTEMQRSSVVTLMCYVHDDYQAQWQARLSALDTTAG
ncbi:MAG: TetR/AcrR family transcriptional regulator [Pseudomonadota bacterium]